MQHPAVSSGLSVRRQHTVMKAGSLQSTARPRKRGRADAGEGGCGPDGAAGSVALLPAAFMSSLYQAASVLYTYASSLVPTFMLAPSLVATYIIRENPKLNGAANQANADLGSLLCKQDRTCKKTAKMTQ